jgi:isocitrate dehydrogenase (NAD+)
MLLEHIGYADKAKALEKALDYCMFEDKRLAVTGRATGATGQEFCDYVLENLG